MLMSRSGSPRSSYAARALVALPVTAMVSLAAACGSSDSADARPGASAGVAVSPTGPGATNSTAAPSASASVRPGKPRATAADSSAAAASPAPASPLPTTPVPTGPRPDPERPRQGQYFQVRLVEGKRTFPGEVNLREVVIDRDPQDPALEGRQAILLTYTALNTGTLTWRGKDLVADRFFVRSDDQVMGEQRLYGPDDANAPQGCRTAGTVEWRRGSLLEGCAVLTLPEDATLGGIAFFDGRRDSPRLRVLRYP